MGGWEKKTEDLHHLRGEGRVVCAQALVHTTRGKRETDTPIFVAPICFRSYIRSVDLIFLENTGHKAGLMPGVTTSSQPGILVTITGNGHTTYSKGYSEWAYLSVLNFDLDRAMSRIRPNFFFIPRFTPFQETYPYSPYWKIHTHIPRNCPRS